MNVVSRAISAALIAPIRLYQRFISPMRPPTCRFYPSCSAYAVTALRIHGPIVGTWLAIRRIGRCHPWTPGGVDHVPPAGKWRAIRPPYDPSERDGDGTDVGSETASNEGAGEGLTEPDDSPTATRSRGVEPGASSLTLWPAWHREMTSPRASLNRGLIGRPTPAPGA
jgi:uncharacterized protein